MDRRCGLKDNLAPICKGWLFRRVHPNNREGSAGHCPQVQREHITGAERFEISRVEHVERVDCMG